MFGIKTPKDLNRIDINDDIPVLNSDSIIKPGVLIKEIQFHTTTICFDNHHGCMPLSSNSKVHNFGFTVFIGETGLNLTGTFGKDQGQYATKGSIILCGVYSFENLNLPPELPQGNIEVFFYSDCPVEFGAHRITDNKPQFYSFYINCGLHSDLFGRGQTTGPWFFELNPDTETNEKYPYLVSGYPIMMSF